MVRAALAALCLAAPALAQEAAGDPSAGERLFARCAGCHALAEPRNGAGPHLVGLVGRAAGSVEGFRYSSTLAGADLVWEEATLAAYLLEPRTAMPGTRKSNILTDPQDVADVVAYLSVQVD